MKLWHLISLVLSSALLVSCGKDNLSNMEDDHMAISFSAEASSMTKAIKPDDPTVLLKAGNKVSLFGIRVHNDEPEQIFTNRILTCDAVPHPSTQSDPNSSLWSYNPVEYWKSNGDYYFSAVFPYDNAITLDNAYALHVSYSAGDNSDLMVARKYRNAAVSKDPVNLVFKHTTSAVRFLFGKTSASAADQYQLTSFQLEGLVPSGQFTLLTQVPGEPSISSSNWSVSNVHTTLFSWTADTQADRKTITHPASASDPGGYTPMGWYYMVPQTLSSDASVRFSVSYNGGNPVETVLNFYGAIDQTSGDPGTSWVPNCVYNYYITLNQSGLDITVRTTIWDEVQVTTDDFNFE